MNSHEEPDDGMTIRTLVVFVVLTFALTWGLGALLFMAPDQVQGTFGPVSYSNPLFILAVYSPGSPLSASSCTRLDLPGWLASSAA